MPTPAFMSPRELAIYEFQNLWASISKIHTGFGRPSDILAQHIRWEYSQTRLTKDKYDFDNPLCELFRTNGRNCRLCPWPHIDGENLWLRCLDETGSFGYMRDWIDGRSEVYPKIRSIPHTRRLLSRLVHKIAIGMK